MSVFPDGNNQNHLNICRRETVTLKIVMELMDLLDDGSVTGQDAADYVALAGCADRRVTPVTGPKGRTDFVHFLIPGKNGRASGGTAPTLGVVGRLGGIGARPARIGFTSDGDGALAALAVAAKLARMARRGDQLEGDVIVTTQICPRAPTRPHEPVPFMDSPVESSVCNRYEIDSAMDAVLCIDTTKGNRILNRRGFAVTPTVRDGWILRTSEALLSIMEQTTGELPAVLPITMQDITPYGNGIYHLNSILQPSVATSAPCVGVAITAVSQVAGCATGASHPTDVEEAVRFVIETAKAFTAGACPFCDEAEWQLIQARYGSMSRLRTMGFEEE